MTPKFETIRCKLGRWMSSFNDDRIFINPNEVKKHKIRTWLNNINYGIGVWLKNKSWDVAPPHIGMDPLILKISKEAEKSNAFKPSMIANKMTCIGNLEISKQTNTQLIRCRKIEPGIAPLLLDEKERAESEFYINSKEMADRLKIVPNKKGTIDIVKFEEIRVTKTETEADIA